MSLQTPSTLPLPSLDAARAALPRLCGDGMDSENLHRYQTSPSVPPSYVCSHKSLQASHKSTFIQKAPRARQIPREPVKGAVKPVSEVSSSEHATPTGVQSTIKRSSGRGQRSETVHKIQIPLYDAPSHLAQTTYNTMQQHKLVNATKHQVDSIVPAAAEEKSREFIAVDLGDKKKQDNVEKVMLNTPPPEEREVEGQTRSSMDQTLEDLTDLKKQLEVQTKINADLKKLLVASMGDDLHCRVESLVRTKAQLACEIGGYTKKMYEDYENLDQMSVQADMWRSKFMAIRVLADKLTSEKNSLQGQWQSGVRAMQQLLQEHEQLRDCMVETHRLLQNLQHSFNPASAQKPPVTSVPNILELCRSNLLLATSLRRSLLGSADVWPATVSMAIHSGPSPAEKLTYQVLAEDTEGSGQKTAVARPMFHNRLYGNVRYEKLTYSGCPRCKGDIHVV